MNVNATLSTAAAGYLYLERSSNSIQLASDEGFFDTAFASGDAVTSQNSRCLVDVGGSPVSAPGTTLTVRLALSFRPAFAGAKSIFMNAQNATLDTLSLSSALRMDSQSCVWTKQMERAATHVHLVLPGTLPAE
jgi:hypothetical protein